MGIVFRFSFVCTSLDYYNEPIHIRMCTRENSIRILCHIYEFMHVHNICIEI